MALKTGQTLHFALEGEHPQRQHPSDQSWEQVTTIAAILGLESLSRRSSFPP
jgi:hypothetical protein